VALAARRKLYALYPRAADKEKERLLSNYYAALQQVRDLEENSESYYKEKLQNRYGDFPLDEDYSQYLKENNISLEEYYRAGAVEDYTDPHYTQNQKDSSFQEDAEESTGTLEDYQKVKGA